MPEVLFHQQALHPLTGRRGRVRLRGPKQAVAQTSIQSSIHNPAHAASVATQKTWGTPQGRGWLCRFQLHLHLHTTHTTHHTPHTTQIHTRCTCTHTTHEVHAHTHHTHIHTRRTCTHTNSLSPPPAPPPPAPRHARREGPWPRHVLWGSWGCTRGPRRNRQQPRGRQVKQHSIPHHGAASHGTGRPPTPHPIASTSTHQGPDDLHCPGLLKLQHHGAAVVGHVHREAHTRLVLAGQGLGEPATHGANGTGKGQAGGGGSGEGSGWGRVGRGTGWG